MQIIALIEYSSVDPTTKFILTILFFVIMAWVVLSRFHRFFEQIYALKYHRPYYLNCIVFKKELSRSQLRILETKFSFYHKLTVKEKQLFRHRLATFIESKTFIVREDVLLTDEMKVLISATAVMLTFGFRDYLIELITTVVIYPGAYYSTTNETYHKGETNPKFGTIVFSWEDFEHGYKIGDDNLNLGIHEFGHAIHLNAFSNGDVSSLIFNQGFENITKYLQNNQKERQRLLDSEYFRAYAFANHFEFFAVLLENFIETPIAFRSEFPNLYTYLKQMLNFRFAGY